MKLEVHLPAWLEELGCPGHTAALSATNAASSSWAKHHQQEFIQEMRATFYASPL